MKKQNQLAELHTVRKDNSLITAKFKSGALEQKLFAIALTRLKIGETDRIPRAKLTTAELKSLLGNDHNLYRKLKSASVNLLAKSQIALIENENNTGFVAFHMITAAEFNPEPGQKDPVFTIMFNQLLTPYITNLKQYTSYELNTIIKLDNPYAIRMYELIKKEQYLLKKQEIVVKEFDLAELKFELGALELDDKTRKLVQEGTASWTEIEEKIQNTSMKRWGHFKSRVLDRAMEEVNEKTELEFSYETIKGAHGTVKRIKIFISENKGDGKKLPEELLDFVGHNGLTKENLELLYLEAKEDASQVLSAIEMADEVPNIENYVGWLRSCIREKWTGKEKIETVNGSKETADKIRIVKQEIEEAKKDPNGEFFKRMYENMQKKDGYEEFISGMTDMEKEYYDLFNYKDKVEYFIDWKKGNRIS